MLLISQLNVLYVKVKFPPSWHTLNAASDSLVQINVMSIWKKIKLHLLGDKYLLLIFYYLGELETAKECWDTPAPRLFFCNALIALHKFPINVYHHGILHLSNIMESRNKKSCICWEIASHTKVTDRRCLYRLWIMQLNTQPQTHTSK